MDVTQVIANLGGPSGASTSPAALRVPRVADRHAHSGFNLEKLLEHRIRWTERAFDRVGRTVDQLERKPGEFLGDHRDGVLATAATRLLDACLGTSDALSDFAQQLVDDPLSRIGNKSPDVESNYLGECSQELTARLEELLARQSEPRAVNAADESGAKEELTALVASSAA